VNELELIERLCRHLPLNASTVVGPGDDCAVLDLGLADRRILFKTDAVVEGVHFTAETDPRLAGRKALARCLSDIAAMAGTPTHAVITLGLPPDCDLDRVDNLYAGLGDCARQHKVGVVGGETTASPGSLWVSTAMLGWVQSDRCVLRSGAHPGDALFVSGELGGSLASGRHLSFAPRLEEARWLAEAFEVHAMIDLSDGLAGDLRHLLKASGVGAELLAHAVPVSPAARAAARQGGRNALAAALTDGEDYELLFAVSAADAVALKDRWKSRFPGTKLSCIGRVMSETTVTLRDAQGRRTLPLHGYVHFQEP
jgi:thiamine-monophosphate kinase